MGRSSQKYDATVAVKITSKLANQMIMPRARAILVAIPIPCPHKCNWGKSTCVPGRRISEADVVFNVGAKVALIKLFEDHT